MKPPPTSDRNLVLGGLALGSLFASGIVLALSWAVPFPDAILTFAWLVALVAMTAVFVFAFRESRASGTGFMSALIGSFKALGRFMFWFF